MDKLDQEVVRFRHRARHIAFKYEKDRELSEELAQDMLLHLWEKRDLFEEKSEFSTWATRVCENFGKNYVRDEVERQPQIVYFSDLEGDVDAKDEEVTLDDSWLMEDRASDPAEILMAEEQVEQSIDRLTPTEQRVYQCMYIDCLSAAETAAELGMERDTVYRHVSNIRNKSSDI